MFELCGLNCVLYIYYMLCGFEYVDVELWLIFDVDGNVIVYVEWLMMVCSVFV